MKELIIKNYKGINVTDSRKVAEMIGKAHAHLCRDIQGYIKVISQNPKMDSDKFFIESSYRSGTGKEYTCYLLTKQGCEMVANKMTGEKGILFTAEYVQAFNKMEEHIKEQALNTSDLSPELQMFKQIFDTVAKSQLEQKQMQKEIDDNKRQIQGIRDVVAINSNDWKNDCKKLITKIAYKLGSINHINDVYKEVYSTLDKRLGTKLQIRLTNKRRRMADEGVCKSKRDKLTYINVIEDDKKLIEGYIAIVKELSIKYGVDLEE